MREGGRGYFEAVLLCWSLIPFVSSHYSYDAESNLWLKLHLVPTNFNEAMLTCHYEGGRLASPLNSQFRKAMTKMMLDQDLVSNAIYTGIHATYAPGVFTSIEGAALGSRIAAKWAPGEPNTNGDDHCILMTADGSMRKTNCAKTRAFICYKNKQGLMHVNPCGTGDLEYKLDNRTGSCYKFHREGHSWPRAYMICATEGGHLAVINSPAEAEVLKDLMLQNPEETIKSSAKLSASIGFRDCNEHNLWLTIHGETLEKAGYAEWSENEPNNVMYDEIKGENCGSILRYGKGGLLNDVPCQFQLSFICEITPRLYPTLRIGDA